MHDPDIWDVLIVGGGPAGTAAAFRCRELKIRALVIELDAIMKRIRDYDQAKTIKPDFGPARQMSFPKGGDLIEKLHFFADIKGTDLVARWTKLYREHSVPARTGVEFIGLDSGDAGPWSVRVRDHSASADETISARHVVLALGAGMPRRLDVPGNVRSIATKLGDPSRYVDQPVCVLGGGTSAAEAVVAISKAKEREGVGDVFWSHRGRRMPAVSHALAEELFRATTLRGNVRYLPGSEARAVVSDGDGREWLRLETDRRLLDGRPPETTNLEFDVRYCVVCIGQEIDKRLLGDIGVHFAVGGPQSKKGLPLTPLLESRQRNVYIIGDTLNAAYLECDAFDDSPSNFRAVKHRGNIKASLTDGVRVAEAIAQKLAGRKDVTIHVDFEDGQGPSAVSSEASQAEPDAVLISLLDGEVEAEQFVLHADRPTTLGRAGCDINFGDDRALADHHASIVVEGDHHVLRVEEAAREVFLNVTEGRERPLDPGAVVRVGEQWLAFGGADAPLGFDHHDQQGRHVAHYRLSEGTAVLGRTAPDFSIAQDDLSLSRRHALIIVRQGRVFLRDLSSVNGLYVRVRGATQLVDGDIVRLGGQALRFARMTAQPRSVSVRVDISSSHARRVRPPRAADPVEVTLASETPVAGPPEALATGSPSGSAVVPSPPPEAGAAPVQSLPEGLTVTFQPSGTSCPFKVGDRLCDIAKKAGVPLSTDCETGSCGEDPVRVLAGLENLSPESEEERGSLSTINGLEGPHYRLACVTFPNGPVVVELVE